MSFRLAARPARLIARAAASTPRAAAPLAVRRLATSSPARAARLVLACSAKASASSVRCSAPWAAAARRAYSAGGGGLTEEEVFSRIARILEGFDKVKDPSQITEDAQFHEDLGLDSLDTVEVVMAIEEEFSLEIPDKEADKIRSVSQAVQYITAQPDAV